MADVVADACLCRRIQSEERKVKIPVWLVCFFVMVGPLRGQTSAQPAASKAAAVPPAKPLLSPGAAYQEALRPVTVTRASVANWSATEQAALGISIRQAAEACDVRAVKDYTGDALVDLGHLCSMGRDFTTSLAAVSRYLDESAARIEPVAASSGADKEASAKASEMQPPERLAEAYGLKIDAELHLKDEKASFSTAQEMLAKIRQGQAVEDATAEAINYMQLLFTADAETLAAAREPRLLAAIESAGSDTAAGEVFAQGGLAELFRQALVLPELEQLRGDSAGAQRSFAALEAAVPAGITHDDEIAIAGWRQQYAQLGKPLGSVEALRSLTLPAKMPQIPARRAVTALLLFPDWCAQCVRLAHAIPESVFSVKGHEAYMYGLLVETVAPKKSLAADTRSAPPAADVFDPADAAKYLRATSSIVVGAGMLARFNAVDIPLLIVADGEGIVRFISPVDETALQPGNTVDSAVAKVGEQWPLNKTAAATSSPQRSR